MMENAIAYMRARCLGNPAVLANFIFIGTLRGIKDAKTPLYAAILANLSNLLMDILFVYGLGWGAGGAALATALSQMLSCAIMFGVLMRRCGTIYSLLSAVACFWSPAPCLHGDSERSRTGLI
jgi:Na+-driven multidrug efflux pump